MNNARGRKTSFTEEMLVSIIIQYAQMHPGKKIVMKDLIEYSGISKATWYRSKKAKDKICQLNYAPLIAEANAEDIPTITEIRKNCGNDLEKYVEVIEKLIDIIAEQSDEINAKTKSDDVLESTRIRELQSQIKEKDRLILKLNTRLNADIYDKDEMINIRENMDKMDVDTFQKQFGDLFDD